MPRRLVVVIQMNPVNGSRVNATAGKAFTGFTVAPEAQALIGSFGIERYRQRLFFPAAGRAEDRL